MVQESASTAEDDAQRSAHIRRLVFDDAPHAPALPTRPIPRVIVQFWHDPAHLPSDVAECIDSWRPLIERGFRHSLFSDATARAFISSFLGGTYTRAFDRCGHPAMRCDYFRLCWMLLRGGFYVDADECYLGTDCDELFADRRLQLQPLCYDLSADAMIPACDFLNEQEHSIDRIYYVNNNPLVGPRGHPIIRLALERATGLLLHSPSRDIQSTTGPGNLTASLVRHSVGQGDDQPRDFRFVVDWDAISVSRWPLSYREDERNWRLWSAAQ